MHIYFKKFLLSVLTVCGLFCVFAQAAQASLAITPTHLVFEDRDRFASVTLINTGDTQRTYEMDWRFFRMQETGTAYKPVKGSITDFDLSEHVVFTPRRVTLAPKAKQKIRVAVRRPKEMEPGDYRAHLLFAPVAEEEFSAESEDTENTRAGININVGYTIPVILRVGTPDVKMSIGDVTIAREPRTGKLKASVPLLRQGGPYGALGYLYVYYTGPSGQEELIGQLSNANVFPEVNRRVVDIALSKDNLSTGSLRVVLEHNDKVPENRFIYAERVIPLR